MLIALTARVCCNDDKQGEAKVEIITSSHKNTTYVPFTDVLGQGQDVLWRRGKVQKRNIGKEFPPPPLFFGEAAPWPDWKQWMS